MNTFRNSKHRLQQATTIIKVAGLASVLFLTGNLVVKVDKTAQQSVPFSLISQAFADDDNKEREKEEREHAREEQEKAQERAREEAKKQAERQKEEREKQEEQAKSDREKREKQLARDRAAQKKQAARDRAKEERDRAKEERDRAQQEREREKEKQTTQRASSKRTSTSQRSNTRRASEQSSDRRESDSRKKTSKKKSDSKSKTYRSASRESEDDVSDSYEESENKKDGSNDTDNGSRSKRRRSKYKPQKAYKAPDTVAKMLQQLFGSQKVVQPKRKPKYRKKTVKSRKKAKTTAHKKPAQRAPRRQRRYAMPPVRARANYIPNEVLASNMTPRSLRRAQRLGFRVRRNSEFPGLGIRVTQFVVPRGMRPRQARRLLRGKLKGERISLNSVYRLYHAARGRENTPVQRPEIIKRGRSYRHCGKGQCYGARAIRWRSVLSNCAKSIKIGVIDTSYDHDHPAFIGKSVQNGVFVSQRRKTAPKKHGTGVLALLMGNPRTTTAGLIPNAKFYTADVFFADSQGYPVSDSVSMLKALSWMDAFGVNIINLSLTGPKDPLIEKAIAKMSRKGVIFVAAAGNNGPAAAPSYPAAYRQVIAVTAVNKRLRSYRYANRGSYIDIAAPGVDIWTAMPGSKAGYQSGTSFAAPYVTAVIATKYRKNSRLTKSSILRQISTRDLGSPGRDKIYGRGLVIAPTKCGAGPAIAKASLAR